ncbi:hypothetical protein P691DRAFT_797704 [Macrolepiota fuliginosa MF-IS2]|uniref:Casein kinase substrate phosphoprotein PP28 domain-containing protein n=1 Tax=Macrolepiota fuliginosa MF-IS2 TaxID=1400762 RepID=A0A9P5XJJ4_9AGAR|nr:hypothetical protein P691DRAFT_797704 [Macrolepiota fuliginosa MF-IS2]
MVRGSGKYKAKRGGGRSFSRNMASDRDASAFPDGDHRGKNEDDSEEEEESEEGSEESEESEEEESGEGKSELTRAQRREMKKKQGVKQPQQDGEDEDDEDADLINPNHVQKKMTISDLNEPRQMTRREREQKEKKEAEEKYWKLHLQGKTDKAKADLERLTKIRAEREAAAAKRQAENEGVLPTPRRRRPK